MTDLTAVAQIMTSAVGLVGAGVAGLSVYFTYRGRHNQFRQAVYNRQMDAYFDISESMSHLYTAAESALDLGGPWLKGEDARARLRSSLRDGHERFTGTVNRSLIVLPSKVKSAVDTFNETLLAICEPDEEGLARQPADDGEQPLEPGQELARAYRHAIN